MHVETCAPGFVLWKRYFGSTARTFRFFKLKSYTIRNPIRTTFWTLVSFSGIEVAAVAALRYLVVGYYSSSCYSIVALLLVVVVTLLVAVLS